MFPIWEQWQYMITHAQTEERHDEGNRNNVLDQFGRKHADVMSQINIWRHYAEQTKHIRSARTMDTFALTAWVTRIITSANGIPKLGKYHKGSVNLNFMREVARFSVLDDGPCAARDFLTEHGIPLIIEQHLSSTYLDGAAILVFSERPIIGMTLRHDRLDNFWFTLMHELAHVALHSDQESTEFIDDLDIEAKEDPREVEADCIKKFQGLLSTQVMHRGDISNMFRISLINTSGST